MGGRFGGGDKVFTLDVNLPLTTNQHFSIQLTMCRTGNLTRLIHTLAICVTIRRYTRSSAALKVLDRVQLPAFGAHALHCACRCNILPEAHLRYLLVNVLAASVSQLGNVCRAACSLSVGVLLILI